MSREELQVNFRMPASLKRDLETAAKSNGRSLTAEIVLRLEVSVSMDTPRPDRFLPAHRALSLAEFAQRDVSALILSEVQRRILVSANAGHTFAFVPLAEYDLDKLPMEKLVFLEKMREALIEQGYTVKMDELNSITIDFSRPS